jgi:propanol-preferring alcohol dehydrogenase
MKAAMVVEYNQPLKIVDDVPIPRPGRNQILVRILASSLCMSDLMGIQGLTNSPLPYCGGHEPVGIIEELDEGVVGFAVGDQVGFMPASSSCQDCTECRTGNHRFCDKRVSVGFHGPYGGFSEYCLADPLSTVKIPDGLSSAHAAPLLCAGVTAYVAVRRATRDLPGGSHINIVGCGGVGHLAIMYAKAMGFGVNAFDITEDKLQLARKCGADTVVNAMITPKEDAQSTPATIVISGSSKAYELGMAITERHGRVIAVGVPHDTFACNVLDMVLRDVSLIPTNQGTKQELHECLELAARKGIKPVIQERSIYDINQGCDDMRAGKIAGRIVYAFD